MSPTSYRTAPPRVSEKLIITLPRLTHLDLLEPESLQKRRERRRGVRRGGGQDPAVERRLADLLLRLLPHLRFEVGIDAREQPRLARVDPRLSVVESRRENLRRGHGDGHRTAIDLD